MSAEATEEELYEAAEELARIGQAFAVDLQRRTVLTRERQEAAAYANSLGLGYTRIARLLGVSRSMARKLCAQGAQWLEE